MSIDETLLMCVVPSLFDLGAYLEQRTSFDEIPAGSRLRGAARLSNGRLELRSPRSATNTSAANTGTHASGSWHSTTTMQPSSELFRADFSILLGGSSESGICFSYGASPFLANASTPAIVGRGSCALQGLCVLFHIAPTRCSESLGSSSNDPGSRDNCSLTGVRARLDGQLLFESPLSRSLGSRSWAPVHVSVEQLGGGGGDGSVRLSVEYAGRAWAHELEDHQWSPSVEWVMGLSTWPAHEADEADAGGAPDAIAWVGHFAMWSASVVTHTAANLSVALNPGTAGQPEGVFLSAPTRYDFYTPPVVHSLVPASGPMADAPLVLVEAHRLGTFASLVGVIRLDPRCKFGGTRVNATYLAPGADFAAAPVARIACYAPVLPSPVGAVVGAGAAMLLPVAVSLNGQQFSGGLVPATPIFVMHPPAIIESIEPSEGPALGGTLIVVRGLHLHYGERHAYRCRLGQHRVVASYVPADGSVRCTTPPQHDLTYNMSIDEAVQLALDTALVSFAAHLNASSNSASSEPCALVASAVASAASDLAQPEPPLRAATQPWNETHVLRCELSTAHYNASVAAAPVAVEISLNDQDFSRASRSQSPAASYFSYAMAPGIEVVEPASGPAFGGNVVVIRGANFSGGVSYSCRFGLAVVNATFHSGVDGKELRCTTPPSYLAGASDVLELDLNDPWLLAHGAALRPNTMRLHYPPYVAREVYIPPEEKVLTSLRIVEEPQGDTTVGRPFEGTLRIELLDQHGQLLLAPRRTEVALRTSENGTMAAGTELLAAPTAQPAVWCGTSSCPPTVVSSSGGRAYFSSLRVDRPCEGIYFEVLVDGAPPQRTRQTYSVRLGPPAKLRFVRAPDNLNLRDVYFGRQPIVEVVDLGGNRVVSGVFAINLSLAEGLGRLRGPTLRYFDCV